MNTLLQRRLPGVRFDVPALALDEALPRMDIAFFVGFTASGPLRVPVAVESLADFEDCFGGEITLLARSDGSPVRGLLHPALRQFFSHGGRRAWVLRVAAPHARTAHFPLQQMLLLRRTDAGAPWRVEPAWVAARAPGSWADRLQVFARCEAQPLGVVPLGLAGDRLSLRASGPLALALAPGDTLRLRLQGDVEQVQGEVIAVEPAQVDARSGRLQRSLMLGNLASLRQGPLDAEPVRVGWTVPVLIGDGSVEHHAPVTASVWSGGSLSLQVRLPAHAQLGPGEVLRVSFVAGVSPAWMALDEVQTSDLAEHDGAAVVRLVGRPWRVPVHLAHAPLQAWVAAGEGATALWLRAGVGAAQPAASEQRADGLALVPRSDGAPSVFSLPDDIQHYTQLGHERARNSGAERAERAFELTPRDTRPLAGPRFALATAPLPADAGQAMLLPLDIGPGLTSGLGARDIDLPALRRDGLDAFDWTLFAEAALAGQRIDTLAAQAEALRLLGRAPQPLRGLHAVFGSAVPGPVEEPTLLLMPDAVQPGWLRKRQRTAARIQHEPAPQPPPPVDDGRFGHCDVVPLLAPEFEIDADPDAAGNYLVRWTRPQDGVGFELQESAHIDFKIASLAYAGSGNRLALIGKPPGHQFYRVRSVLGASHSERNSAWSGVLEVQVGGSAFEVRSWNNADLLALHRLMLRTAAARGDMLALLGLPEHYRWADAIAHVQALRGELADAQATQAATEQLSDVPRLGADEARALSHGALHHPWLMARRASDLISSPPDGAIAGQMAASALDRGAWLAVANQPLKDVVALSLPASGAERQALLQAQVNAVVTAPRGFVLSTAETLLDDADWRAVNVRRLMCLLQRMALRRAAIYVFEPNGDELRRTVERAFEAMLGELQRRGAFAGRNAAQSFRVELGEDLNTAARRDAGQFHVDLKVAPALPLTFLTVRLARSGERLSVREMR